MIGEPGTNGRHTPQIETSRLLDTARERLGRMTEPLRDLSLNEWLSTIALLFVGVLWLMPSTPAEPRVDLAVKSISFDSVDTWDWTTLGCTVGPRVRVVASVRNVGNENLRTGEARVRFVGKAVGGSSADTLVFEEPVGSIGTSRRSDDITVGSTVTLPEAFLTRHSIWTATVIHPEDRNPRNDVIPGKTLNPCRQRASGE
jgi:hypothetical protein